MDAKENQEFLDKHLTREEQARVLDFETPNLSQGFVPKDGVEIAIPAMAPNENGDSCGK